MKQYYSVENFKAINYGDEILSIPLYHIPRLLFKKL